MITAALDNTGSVYLLNFSWLREEFAVGGDTHDSSRGLIPRNL